ncbi:hypothetical protein K501DRAFT_203348, partial [Backusella circina FSU 941]
LGNFDEQPLFDRFLEVSAWSTYTSREFRLRQTLLLLDHTPTISFPSTSCLFFWKIPIAPEAKSLWYRFLFGKMHCRLSVSLFDPSVSPFCQLCGAEHEDILHLVITCHFKIHFWQQDSKRFALFTEFSASRLYELVFGLQRFQLVNNEALYVFASKVIRSIWRYHSKRTWYFNKYINSFLFF